VLPRRLLSRTKIALIIRVHAVGDDVEAVLRAKLFHHRKQLVFAMEAPRSVILAVVRALQLRSLDDRERNVLLLRKRNRILHLGSRQAWRISQHREHLLAERLMRRPCEERRIDTA